jgi:hypothetical protein
MIFRVIKFIIQIISLIYMGVKLIKYGFKLLSKTWVLFHSNKELFVGKGKFFICSTYTSHFFISYFGLLMMVIGSGMCFGVTYYLYKLVIEQSQYALMPLLLVAAPISEDD